MQTSYPTSGPVDTGPGPLYIRIPLEVSQDEALSDGAILLFAEILGLQQRYGACTAGDDHFQRRRHKSRPTIQRQITELSDCGHIRVITDRHTRRELRVAERYLSCKDGGSNFLENEKDGPMILKNEKENTPIIPKNEKDSGSIFLKNETHKTPESGKNQESRKENKTQESCRRDAQNALSDEDQIDATCRALGDAKNLHDYRSLWHRCQEQGRGDAWQTALAATRNRQGKGRLEQEPVAYFRTVLLSALKSDTPSRRQSAPKEAPMPRSYRPYVPPAVSAPRPRQEQTAPPAPDSTPPPTAMPIAARKMLRDAARARLETHTAEVIALAREAVKRDARLQSIHAHMDMPLTEMRQAHLDALLMAVDGIAAKVQRE